MSSGIARGRTSALTGILLLWILLAAVYYPGFQGQWVLDDFGNIHENANVHAAELTLEALEPSLYGRDLSHSRWQRPVAYLTLAVNYYFGGTDPVGYHIVNFLIHCLAALMLYFVALETLRSPRLVHRYGGSAHRIALLGAALWAVHPIQVTAVTYVVQRMAALACLFTLAAVWSYARSVRAATTARRAGWWSVCLLSGLLALGSKQNAVMLPFSLMAYAWYFGPGIGRRRLKTVSVLAVASIALVAAAGMYYTSAGYFASGYAERPFSMAERLMTHPRVIWFYVWLMVYPVSNAFSLLHDFDLSVSLMEPWTTIPAMMSIAVICALAIAMRRRAPLLGFSVLFFYLNHLVEGSVIPLELVFEHRNYLPSTFLAVAAAAGIVRVLAHFRRSRVVHTMSAACVVLVLIAAGHTTYMRNVLFTDAVAFWSDNTGRYPDLHRPHHNLAKALFFAGENELALKEMYLALQARAGAKLAQKLLTHYNLGLFFLQAGHLSRAEHHFGIIRRLSPDHAKTAYQLARIHLMREEPDKAQEQADAAFRGGKGGVEFHRISAAVRLQRGMAAQAMPHARAALRLAPDHPATLFLLGEIALARGNWRSAEFFLETCLMKRPGLNGARLALVEALAAQENAEGVTRHAGILAADPTAPLRQDGASGPVPAKNRLLHHARERLPRIRREISKTALHAAD